MPTSGTEPGHAGNPVQAAPWGAELRPRGFAPAAPSGLQPVPGKQGSRGGWSWPSHGPSRSAKAWLHRSGMSSCLLWVTPAPWQPQHDPEEAHPCPKGTRQADAAEPELGQLQTLSLPLRFGCLNTNLGQKQVLRAGMGKEPPPPQALHLTGNLSCWLVTLLHPRQHPATSPSHPNSPPLELGQAARNCSPLPRHPQPTQRSRAGGHQIFIKTPKSRYGGDWVSELASSPLAALYVPGALPSTDK